SEQTKRRKEQRSGGGRPGPLSEGRVNRWSIRPAICQPLRGICHNAPPGANAKISQNFFHRQPPEKCSCEDVGHDIAADVGEAEVPALESVGKLFVVDADLPKHGRM